MGPGGGYCLTRDAAPFAGNSRRASASPSHQGVPACPELNVVREPGALLCRHKSARVPAISRIT